MGLSFPSGCFCRDSHPPLTLLCVFLSLSLFLLLRKNLSLCTEYGNLLQQKLLFQELLRLHLSLFWTGLNGMEERRDYL
jgi:hypothetical protein